MPVAASVNGMLAEPSNANPCAGARPLRTAATAIAALAGVTNVVVLVAAAASALVAALALVTADQLPSPFRYFTLSAAAGLGTRPRAPAVLPLAPRMRGGESPLGRLMLVGVLRDLQCRVRRHADDLGQIGLGSAE